MGHYSNSDEASAPLTRRKKKFFWPLKISVKSREWLRILVAESMQMLTRVSCEGWRDVGVGVPWVCGRVAASLHQTLQATFTQGRVNGRERVMDIGGERVW